MPVYEYVCEDCEHRFEELVFGSEEPRCPRCEADSPRKLLSTFAVGDAGAARELPPPGGCGTCGDPRGPGACSLD